MIKKVISKFNGVQVEVKIYFLGIRIHKTVYDEYESEPKPTIGYKRRVDMQTGEASKI